jgi:polyhydroxybutyrate depolymerase
MPKTCLSSALQPIHLGLIALVMLTMLLNSSRADTGGILKGKLIIQGEERTYQLYTPASYQPDRPTALVMVFHGYRGKAETMMRQTGFNRLSERDNFLVVYPEASVWRTRSNPSGNDATTGDLLFIQELLSHMKSIRKIDSKRVYAVGLSNGGFFTQRLACEMSGDIAAFATVAATMGKPLSQDCHPTRPIPILLMHGTDDPVVTWDGQVKRLRFAFPESQILSFPDVVHFWREQNQCANTPVIEQLARKNRDKTSVERRLFHNCQGTSEVQQWIIYGGGHTWPGSSEGGCWKRLFAGRTTQTVQASEVIWQFFQQHSL